MNNEDKLERRGFLSICSALVVSTFVSNSSKADRGNIVAAKTHKKNGIIILPEKPSPFVSIVEIEAGRISRLFSNRIIDPGSERINSQNGKVKMKDLLSNLTGKKVYLQYTGPDMGWVTLS